MRSLAILALGFALLGVTLVSVRLTGGRAQTVATFAFIVGWGLFCAANAAMGLKAGHPLQVEIAVFGLTFAPPVAICAFILAKNSSG